MSVLAAALDSATVQRIFAKLCGLHQVVTSQPEQRHELEWVISRQLEDLLRLTAPKVTEPCRRPILGERQESFTTGGITFGSTIPSSF